MNKLKPGFLSKKPKPPTRKKTLRISVLDFTIWNGFKFGFGLAIGLATFEILSYILGEGLLMSMMNLLASFGDPSSGI